MPIIRKSAPRGKGLYVRQWTQLRPDPFSYLRALRVQWVGLNPLSLGRSLATVVGQCKRAGFRVWLYATPSAWMPYNWRATLADFVEAALASKADGIIADPETDWPSEPDQAAVALRDELVNVRRATGLSIGLTTYPDHRHADVWAHRALWGSPQTYDRHNTLGPDYPRRFIARWKARPWLAVIPSLALWNKTPEQQAAYLRTVPKVRGAIFWYGDQSDDPGVQAPDPAGGAFRAAAQYEPRPWWMLPVVLAAAAFVALVVALVVAMRRPQLAAAVAAALPGVA